MGMVFRSSGISNVSKICGLFKFVCLAAAAAPHIFKVKHCE